MFLSLKAVKLLGTPVTELPTPRVAISACLHGQPVRYDGTAKSLESTLDKLHNYLQLIPICPEVGAGMSVPRPPVQLQKEGADTLRVIGRDNPSLDVTSALLEFGAGSLEQSGSELCGYIVKSRSPSCGYKTTPVFNGNREQIEVTSGVQIALFQRRLPWLQIIDETALARAGGCEDFIARCLVMSDLRLHGQEDDLDRLHQRYASLIARMPDAHQAALAALLETGAITPWWHTFGAGLQAVAEIGQA